MADFKKHLIPTDNDYGTLWNRWAITDPEFVKDVKYGKREFSAIAPMYKAKRLTEAFGPCGVGWGWDPPKYYTLAMDSVLVCELVFWYMHEGVRREIPSTSASSFAGDTRCDTDAFKKAQTDAITKAISWLGHSADVFLGRFDDEKYVDGIRDMFGDVESHRLETEAKAAAKDRETKQAAERKAKREAETPDDRERIRLYGIIKLGMQTHNLTAEGMAAIVGHYWPGKTSAVELTLDELTELVKKFDKWSENDNSVSALLEEIAVAKGTK